MDPMTFLNRSRKIKLSLWDEVAIARNANSSNSSRLLLTGKAARTTHKILIVDDDQVILKALSLKLSANGFEVFTAAEGSDAITAMRDHKPDLILLDINFPPDVFHPAGIAWDGFQLMNWLRIVAGKAIPIILMTAGEADDQRHAALAAGAVEFFQKPFQPAALLVAMKRALEHQPHANDTEFRFDPEI
jgi:two-component system KDP operon response regulator KdpE